jgi:hypothetical protein
MGGEVGEANERFQSYCYRMVLTNVPTNRVPVQKPPPNYQESDYELLFRVIECGYEGPFFKTSLMPNRKTDSNNIGGISTDYIGGNYGTDWNWTTLNNSQRHVVAAKHRDWQLGLLWTLQNHPRVPNTIRTSVGEWGLPKDEFVDNQHWPYNIYVREGRRMHSDFVTTEQHIRRELPVHDPIGLGDYTFDSHNTQRFVTSGGMVQNEGDVEIPIIGEPYGISYSSIVPCSSECGNLLVPWALSATHIAFGSIRMESVLMILGQSAATAACLALDDDVRVQQVDYSKLASRLIADGQKLSV